MQFEPLASETFIQAVTTIETELDAVVDHGSDDDLFVASYLQGHFAVLARQLEMQSDATIDTLDAVIRQSLGEAFANQELEPDDQTKVLALWQGLVAQTA